MRKYICLLTFAWLLMHPAAAQEERGLRQVYAQAEQAYQIGKLDEAIRLLQNDINGFEGNTKQNALRLLAICYLAQDDSENSEMYAQYLLNENPYYTSVQDPVRFEELILRLKSGRYNKIITASSHEESVSEAPVPVTIITREMIDALSNNKSIGQILATYVPGMNEVCAYAIANVAMHGVYTSGQEKILIMENGHRLNARSTNNGKLDYSISTEKIDHIEVLRGPASSLYGNVALTAVVNIITKSGHEVDGVKVKYGYGSHSTHRADIVAGTSFFGADVLAWGSIYHSDGECVHIPKFSGNSNTPYDGYAYVGRYEGNPSYDLGCRIAIKDFNFMISRRSGKLVPQYSWYGMTYDYDRYRQLGGVRPGFSTEETHTELGYNKTLGNTDVSVSLYGDWYKFYDYQPVSDSIVTVEFSSDGSGTPLRNPDGSIKTRLYHGLYQDDNWEEYTVGLLAKVSHSYRLGKTSGNLLIGGQFEYYRIPYNEFFFGDEYDRILIATTPRSANQLVPGSEKSFSAFVQEKHYIVPNKLILNVGFRYDKKLRKNDKRVSDFSPRAALIYMPSKYISTKLTYARSFVDAPYFYRHNNHNTYRGSENLMPENMSSVQFNVLGTIPNYNFNYDVCLFYNHLTDMIVNNQQVELSAAKFVNAGSLKIAGAEAVLGYRNTSFRSRLNMTYQYAIKAERYYYESHHVYSIPAFTANLTAEKRLLSLPRHTIWMTGNLKYDTDIINGPNSRYPQPAGASSRADGYMVLDLGLKYNYHKKLEFSFFCDNVFNKKYYIGGTSYFPYQYPGRRVMGTLSYKF